MTDEKDPEGQEIVVPEPEADIKPEGKEISIAPEGEKQAESPAQKPDETQAQFQARLEALERDNQHWRNQHNGLKRINEKLVREVETLRQNPPRIPSEKQSVSPDRSELDKLVEQGDWDKAVERLAEKKIEEKLSVLQQKQIQDRQQADRVIQFQQAQTDTVFKYPDLADDSSELTEFYLQVLDKYPQYKNDPNGPYLTMVRMEEEAMRLGINLDPSPQWKEAVGYKAGVNGNKEVARRTRAQAGSVGAGRGAGSGRTYTLSKEQQEVIRNSGLDPQSYARVAAQLEGGDNGGIQA